MITPDTISQIRPIVTVDRKGQPRDWGSGTVPARRVPVGLRPPYSRNRPKCCEMPVTKGRGLACEAPLLSQRNHTGCLSWREYTFGTAKSQHCPTCGATFIRDKQTGHGQMYRTQRGVAVVVYLAGAFWFAYYDMLVRADWNLESVIGYGATWPLRLLSLV